MWSRFIAKNFWLLAMLITGINVCIFWYRSKHFIKQNPELAPGYKKIFQMYFFWLNMPWIVMGVGIINRGAPSLFHYFRPQDGNPYVLAWYISIFTLWVVGTYWLIFKGGAEMLVKHPGSIRGGVKNPLLIKILWLICLVWGLAGVLFLFTHNIPLPY